jgi:hypothetical protein
MEDQNSYKDPLNTLYFLLPNLLLEYPFVLRAKDDLLRIKYNLNIIRVHITFNLITKII